jgi:hypothetical protein
MVRNLINQNERPFGVERIINDSSFTTEFRIQPRFGSLSEAVRIADDAPVTFNSEAFASALAASGENVIMPNPPQFSQEIVVGNHRTTLFRGPEESYLDFQDRIAREIRRFQFLDQETQINNILNS